MKRVLALALQGLCIALPDPGTAPGIIQTSCRLGLPGRGALQVEREATRQVCSPLRGPAQPQEEGCLALRSAVAHLRGGGSDDVVVAEVARQREERKKAKAEEKRLKKLAKEQSALAAAASDEPDVSYSAAGPSGLPEQRFGNLLRVQSREQDALPQARMDALRNVADLAGCASDQAVWVRARVQNVRFKGNSCFLVLRQGAATVQATLFKGADVSKDMLRFCGALPKVSDDDARMAGKCSAHRYPRGVERVSITPVHISRSLLPCTSGHPCARSRWWTCTAWRQMRRWQPAPWPTQKSRSSGYTASAART